MVAISANADQLYIGIDGGGTKCRATIFSPAKGVLGTGLGGPANPLHGLDRTLESIMVSTQLAIENAGLSLSSVNDMVAGLGLAGVNLPSLYSQIIEWHHPFKKMFLTTDLHTACIGAHEGGDGAVIITGTGSCGFAYVNGKSTIYGGHGFAQGDKGSGAWMGLEAVKVSLLALDGLGPQTSITNAVMAQLQAKDSMAIAEKMAGKPSSVYATLARLVIECANQGDEVAVAIVKDGAGYISDLAAKLMENNPPRLSMIGGLAEPLQKWLRPEIAALVKTPKQPPEMGAVYYAQSSFAV
ncbi:N-acetylglucosamine kinase [Pseudoalteromonas tunicata]|jgi:glucosamine kinase|uniref:ATPase BadF/BadG/BcrA/BcrD type domain-containing protein n=1 Tax=Pseudoalteromonas tunicata D2 TaxID=87626 RepID=A4CBP1_9GAMM|nr:BadF/BadG/BcrA/BcrD ATPase family protein [Pseudoalteromonas tunicata]ATC94334.1 glucosamine kinase [Pseudoalteromonas tunicata]AXT30074.1 ATPase [Pseudoalteromonas tunicata]EAR27778.1 hypothetical protein PTD2_18190 [Pseudoalteromonas tunicata D2]MDP4982962.1 ATPase [Pseudoalteromonas tunicata]MDP5211554.1 ATPase [Pseudoalteromonas tunicata]